MQWLLRLRITAAKLSLGSDRLSKYQPRLQPLSGGERWDVPVRLPSRNSPVVPLQPPALLSRITGPRVASA